MEKTVSKYLTNLNIPISKSYCERLIISHPDYPSYLSISDTLERLNIKHKVVQVDKEDLSNLSFPYLFQPNTKGEELTIIKDEKSLAASTANIEYSSAIILHAKHTNVIIDKENDRELSRERYLSISSTVFILAIASLILLVSLPVSLAYACLLLTAISGAVIGYFLIAKDFGITYEAVESFCTTGNTDCDRILNSEDAKILGNITFSDAAVSYFIFQLLIIAFLIPVTDIGSFLWILTMFSTLTIPVVLYSLYYQFLKAKIRCRLCLLVDAVLVFQMVILGYMAYGGGVRMGDMPSAAGITSVFLLAAIVSAILLLRLTIEKATSQAQITSNRIKHSPEVFTHLLFQEGKVQISPFEQELLIGKPDAPIKVLMAANPGCASCSKGFQKATELVSMYPNTLKKENVKEIFPTHLFG